METKLSKKYFCSSCQKECGTITLERNNDYYKVLVDSFTGKNQFGIKYSSFTDAMEYLKNDNLNGLLNLDRETVPFYCPKCNLSYCSDHMQSEIIYDETFYDYTNGTCPNGHQRIIDD